MIEFHADDYGLCRSQSEVFTRCIEKNELNGISAFANSEFLEEALHKVLPYTKTNNLRITIHLNFFEGKCSADPKKIPKLVNRQGNLSCSFGKLLLYSFLPERSKVKQQITSQIREEIRAQISCFKPFLSDGLPLRIDSHAHYHAIPIIFDALMDVIEEDSLYPEYIRIPKEHISFYQGMLVKVKIINIVKAAVLNILLDYDLRRQKKRNRKIKQILSDSCNTVFLGVVLSGHMFSEPIKKLLLQLEKCGVQNAEILFHPGTITSPEEISCITSTNDREFWSSAHRNSELRSLEILSGNDLI